jgi:hypothetical protein
MSQMLSILGLEGMLRTRCSIYGFNYVPLELKCIVGLSYNLWPFQTYFGVKISQVFQQ